VGDKDVSEGSRERESSRGWCCLRREYVPYYAFSLVDSHKEYQGIRERARSVRDRVIRLRCTTGIDDKEGTCGRGAGK
jgi:hypothetical protein